MARSIGVFDSGKGFDVLCFCGWASLGWASEDLAVGRAEQHAAEHQTGEPAPALHQYRASKGLGPKPFSVADATHVIDVGSES